MKTAVLIIFLASSFQFAQILNPGFESWTNDDPGGWGTTDFGSFNAVSQSADAHSGSSALKMEVINNGSGGPFSPIVEAGENHQGFSISERYLSLNGFYKSAPVGSDVIIIAIYMFKETVIIGTGGQLLRESSSYSAFNFPINYITEETPDLCLIIISFSDSISGGLPDIGSALLLDDLSFGGTTAAPHNDQNVSSFGLTQNYPNPFNPGTVIGYRLSVNGKATLKVYDLLGREAAVLVNVEKPAGEYEIEFNAGDLPAGVYFYKLEIVSGENKKSFSDVKKMILLK